MAEIYKYDEAAATQKTVKRIRAAWNDIRKHSSTGQKAWLTQMKNYYIRMIQTDPEAAAEMLAAHEYRLDEKEENESSAVTK
jgi:hypothetical protein